MNTPGKRRSSRTASGRRIPQVNRTELQQQLADSNPAGVAPASASLPDQPDGIIEDDNEDVVEVSNPTGESRQITKAVDGAQKPSKYEVGWRRVVRNFSPS